MLTADGIDRAILLLKSCPNCPEGKRFGEWGARWSYHFDDTGRWVKGKVRRPSGMMGQHGGSDLLAAEGTPQVAPAAGVVVQAGWQNPDDHLAGYGLRVILLLDKMGGLLLTGGHFSNLIVKKGDAVRRGQTLGLSGSSGNTTGPHVHWQLEKPGPYPRTPVPFLWVEV